MNVFLRRLLAVAWLAALISCGSEDPARPESTPDGTYIVGVAGASIEAGDPAGYRLAIEVPAGALLRPETLWLRAAVASGPTKASFELGPAGFQFHQPVVLTLQVPEDEHAPHELVLRMSAGDDRLGLNTDFDSGSGTLRATVYTIGFPAATSTKEDVESSSIIDVEQTSCPFELAALSERFEAAKLWFTQDGHATIVGEKLGMLIQQYNLTKVLCDGEGDLVEIQEQLANLACQEYTDAIADAEVVGPPDTPEELEALLLPLVATVATRQVVGADCGPPIEEPLGSGFDKYLDLLDARVSAPGWIDDTPWDAIWGELLAAAHRVRLGALMWGVESAESRINTELLPLMYDRLREGAFAACGDDNDPSYLGDLLTGGQLRAHSVEPGGEVPWWSNVTSSQLVRDLQHCGSTITAKVYDAAVELLVTGELGAGDSPGDIVDTMEIAAPYDGFIDLAGPIRALLCFGTSIDNPATFDNEKLLIYADNQVLGEVSPSANGEYLTSPFDISMAEVLELLGLPEEADQTLDLTVGRQGTACGGSYGSPSFLLYRFEVTTTDGTCEGSKVCEPTLVLNLSFPEMLEEGEPARLAVDARIQHPNGSSDYAEDVQVDLSITGGTATTLSGLTDDEGQFESEIELHSGSDSVEITITAESLDGLTAEAVITAVNMDSLPIRVLTNYATVLLSATLGPGPNYVGHTLSYSSQNGDTHSVFVEWDRSAEREHNGGQVGVRSHVLGQSNVLTDPETGLLSGLEAHGLVEGSAEALSSVEYGPTGLASGQVRIDFRFRINEGTWQMTTSGELFGETPFPDERWESLGDHTDVDGGRFRHDFESSDAVIGGTYSLGPGDYLIVLATRGRGVTNRVSTPSDFEGTGSFDFDMTIERVD